MATFTASPIVSPFPDQEGSFQGQEAGWINNRRNALLADTTQQNLTDRVTLRGLVPGLATRDPNSVAGAVVLGGGPEAVTALSGSDTSAAALAAARAALFHFPGDVGASEGGAPSGGGASPAAGGGSANVPAEYLPFYQEASQRTGIPVDVLVAQAAQESRFNPNAVGGAGEIGLHQILPSTARAPGFGMSGIDPATLRDPRTNINFAADYLKARGGPRVDFSNPATVDAALRNYNGGGDPNYVANVRRHMAGGAGVSAPGPRAVPVPVAQATPGAVPPAAPGGLPVPVPAPVRVAGPGAPTDAPPAPTSPAADANHDHAISVSGGLMEAILNAPPEQRPALWAQYRPIMLKAGAVAAPVDYPGDAVAGAMRDSAFNPEKRAQHIAALNAQPVAPNAPPTQPVQVAAPAAPTATAPAAVSPPPTALPAMPNQNGLIAPGAPVPPMARNGLLAPTPASLATPQPSPAPAKVEFARNGLGEYQTKGLPPGMGMARVTDANGRVTQVPMPLPNTVDAVAEKKREADLAAQNAAREAEQLRLRQLTSARDEDKAKNEADQVLRDLAPSMLDGTISDADRRRYSLAATHYTKPGAPQLIQDPNDPTKQVLASIPGVIPHGFPLPDYRPPTAGASGVSDRQGAPIVAPGTSRPADMTTEQANAGLYADRMVAANEIINQTGTATAGLIDRAAGAVPVIGNAMVSDAYQRGEQAQRDFINAVLRRESGAAISEAEFANAKKQYFPQPGDGPAVLKQKADSRAAELAGIQRAAGQNYRPPATTQTSAPGHPPEVKSAALKAIEQARQELGTNAANDAIVKRARELVHGK